MRKKKTMRMKHADEKYLGPEPTTINSRLDYIHALNWYNHFNDITKARSWLDTYCKSVGIDPSLVKNPSVTMCAIARMITRDMDVPVDAITFLNDRLIETSAPVENNVIKMAPRRTEIIGDIDDVLDTFYNDNYTYFEPQVYELLKAKAVIPKEARNAQIHYGLLLSDLEQHPEDYASHGKRKYNAYVKFVRAIIDQINLYLDAKKEAKPRKPRKKRAVVPSKVVKAVKYQKEDAALRLTSIAPEKLLEAEEAWLYNTKYRQLIRVSADEGVTLTIKGTTIQNVGEVVSKRLRKPEVFLAEFRQATAIKRRKMFKDIRTKEAAATGRINANTIILAAK